MQPYPIADTCNPLLPSVRVFMVAPRRWITSASASRIRHGHGAKPFHQDECGVADLRYGRRTNETLLENPDIGAVTGEGDLREAALAFGLKHLVDTRGAQAIRAREQDRRLDLCERSGRSIWLDGRPEQFAGEEAIHVDGAVQNGRAVEAIELLVGN